MSVYFGLAMGAALGVLFGVMFGAPESRAMQWLFGPVVSRDIDVHEED